MVTQVCWLWWAAQISLWIFLPKSSSSTHPLKRQGLDVVDWSKPWHPPPLWNISWYIFSAGWLGQFGSLQTYADNKVWILNHMDHFLCRDNFDDVNIVFYQSCPICSVLQNLLGFVDWPPPRPVKYFLVWMFLAIWHPTGFTQASEKINGSWIIYQPFYMERQFRCPNLVQLLEYYKKPLL